MSDLKPNESIDIKTQPELVEGIDDNASAPASAEEQAQTATATPEPQTKEENSAPAAQTPLGAPILKRSIATTIDVAIVSLIVLFTFVAIGMGIDIYARLNATQEWLPKLKWLTEHYSGMAMYAIYAVAFVGATVTWLYAVIFETSPTQATIGKRIMGLKAMRFDGSRIDLKYTFKRLMPQFFLTQFSTAALLVIALLITRADWLQSAIFFGVPFLFGLYGTTLISKSRLTLLDRQWGRAVVEISKDEFRRTPTRAEIALTAYIATGAALCALIMPLRINDALIEFFCVPQELTKLNTTGSMLRAKHTIPAGHRIEASDFTVERDGRLRTLLIALGEPEAAIGKYPESTIPAGKPLYETDLKDTMYGVTKLISVRPMVGAERWKYSLNACNHKLAQLDEKEQRWEAEEVYSARAWVYIQMGDKERALADYTKALELASYDHDARFGRAQLYYELGQYDKALQDCNEDAGERRLVELRAQIHRRMGQFDLAMQDEQLLKDWVPYQPDPGLDAKRRGLKESLEIQNRLQGQSNW